MGVGDNAVVVAQDSARSAPSFDEGTIKPGSGQSLPAASADRALPTGHILPPGVKSGTFMAGAGESKDKDSDGSEPPVPTVETAEKSPTGSKVALAPLAKSASSISLGKPLLGQPLAQLLAKPASAPFAYVRPKPGAVAPMTGAAAPAPVRRGTLARACSQLAELFGADDDEEEEESEEQEGAGTRDRGLTVIGEHAACAFDEIKLGEASKRAIRTLDDDDEVVVLMPAMEYVVPHGPKRSVLFWLCGNLVLVQRVNGFLDGTLARAHLPWSCRYAIAAPAATFSKSPAGRARNEPPY